MGCWEELPHWGKKEIHTIQVNVSPVDDFGVGLQKSHPWALALGKTDQEIASKTRTILAWTIQGHRALAFDLLPLDDGASSSESGKKSKKAKKKEVGKEAKKAKKAKSLDRDKAGTLSSFVYSE